MPKLKSVLTPLALSACLLVAPPLLAAPPDWNSVDGKDVTVFYPGQASLEWALDESRHSAAPDVTKKKRYCAKCHAGDANEIGDKIAAGKPVGTAKEVLEPSPVAGKAGSIPVMFKAAHDGEKLYLRFEWQAPQAAGDKLDEKNEMKLTVLFDGGGTVGGAELNGCWSSCHDDLRGMQQAKDDKKTKYIKDADLGSGKFYDLMQYRSGEAAVDGYIAEQRVMEGGQGLVKAEGAKQGDKWVVTMERKLAAAGKGDHNISADKVYYFGFAIHPDHAAARYHYVSLGYRFGLDKEMGKRDKNYYNVKKQ